MTYPKSVKEIKNLNEFIRKAREVETDKYWSNILYDCSSANYADWTRRESRLKWKREMIQKYLNYKNKAEEGKLIEMKQAPLYDLTNRLDKIKGITNKHFRNSPNWPKRFKHELEFDYKGRHIRIIDQQLGTFRIFVNNEPQLNKSNKSKKVNLDFYNLDEVIKYITDLSDKMEESYGFEDYNKRIQQYCDNELSEFTKLINEKFPKIKVSRITSKRGEDKLKLTHKNLIITIMLMELLTTESGKPEYAISYDGKQQYIGPKEDVLNFIDKYIKDDYKLEEKASIDWNNYLTPEEVKKFLSKDDKVESAENIIYSKEFEPRYKDLHNSLQAKYKNSWTRKELVQDLNEFYNFGHLITESKHKIEEKSRNELLAKTKSQTITRYNKAQEYKGFYIRGVDTDELLKKDSLLTVNCQVGNYRDQVQMENMLYWIEYEIEERNHDLQVTSKYVTQALMDAIDGMNIKVDCECRGFSL